MGENDLNFWLLIIFYTKKYGYKTEKSSPWALAADDPLVDIEIFFMISEDYIVYF